ncbi:hypothetical protein [Sunxiuqinia indica]|uniref:hypothetical protein n=1 Tax=Sunxiuqinia indica TaxID=2692584 RepID=UPI0013589D5B|nr:hypothetical protein [Sunxiuqinia indica]
MKIKRIIIPLLILLAGLFIFRNAILGKISKGWEKDFSITETTDFTIDLKTNSEKGCPKSGVFFTGDTLEVYNFKLKDLIYFISSTTLNSTEIIGHGSDSKSRYNFAYYPKDSAGFYMNHKIEILSILGKEFNFTYQYDTVKSIVYKPTIVNDNQLKKVSAEKLERFKLGDDYILFKGNNLDGIFRAFDYKIKGLTIESDLKDSLFYSFKIPSIKKDEIISYLYDDLGIELSKEEKLIELLTIEFN